MGVGWGVSSLQLVSHFVSLSVWILILNSVHFLLSEFNEIWKYHLCLCLMDKSYTFIFSTISFSRKKNKQKKKRSVCFTGHESPSKKGRLKGQNVLLEERILLGGKNENDRTASPESIPFSLINADQIL